MSKVWGWGWWTIGVGVGALTVALALVAGAAHGQLQQPAQEPPANEAAKPQQQQPGVLVQRPVAAPAPAPVGGPINITAEIITGVMILIFAAGFVVGLTLVARFFFSLAAPKDPEVYAYGDPWVRARLAQLDAEAINGRPADTAE